MQFNKIRQAFMLNSCVQWSEHIIKLPVKLHTLWCFELVFGQWDGHMPTKSSAPPMSEWDLCRCRMAPKSRWKQWNH